MAIDAAYRPRTDDVLLIRDDGVTFAIPASEADTVAAAIRVVSRTPHLARVLSDMGGQDHA
ncbi:hypothetical protein [uncultured Sphingomonas sp.]|uniref:hypothetical protein n=1 Tax=uncultured Sphingomonas sp. TaxID=158754 RepID=UPI0030F8CD02